MGSMTVVMNNCATSILQLIRFGLVGLAATLTHASILWALVEGYRMPATVATLSGFLVAFVVSYLGQFHITFRSERTHKRTLPRYALVATGGVSLHGLIFVVVIDLIGWHYWIAFAITIALVPVIVFVMSKRLIFNPVEKH